jgi:hypothetical protein
MLVITSTYKEINSELLDFLTFSIVRCSRKIENTKFRKLDLFPTSGEGTSRSELGPLGRAILDHCQIHYSHLIT